MEIMQAKGSGINIQANGITMCYDDYGISDLPVIFIHGFPFNKSSWHPQIEFLKNTHRVIAYDIRGFGNSGMGNEKLSISLFADDLIKLMNALQIDKAVVCGLSMGGYILLNAVNRYPERFEAIVLSDTQCIADSAETKAKRSTSIALVEGGGIEEFTSSFIKNIFCEATLKTKPGLTESIASIIRHTSLATLTETLKALAERWETCTSLEEINIPALILCGTKDVITPVEQALYLHQKITDSVYHEISDAGHMSNLEQPELFNKYLDEFIFNLRK